MDANRRSREPAHQIVGCRENHSGPQVSGSLVISDGDSPDPPDSAEEPHDRIARRGDRCVAHSWLCTVAPGGDRADVGEMVDNGVRAVGLVRDDRHASVGFGQQSLGCGAVGGWAGRQAQGLRLSIPIHDRMDLGAPSAPVTSRLRGFAVRKRFGRVAITRDCRSFAPSPS